MVFYFSKIKQRNLCGEGKIMNFFSALGLAYLLSIVLISSAAGESELEDCAEIHLAERWGLVPGCYKETELASIDKSKMVFWRLSDKERLNQGKYMQLPAAAIVLKRGSDYKLVKAYCRNYCFAMGNSDPLPEVVLSGESAFYIWAPEKRLSNRHGTTGRIERFKITSLALETISVELDTGYEYSPFRGIGEINGCRYLVFSAIQFYEPDNSVSIPSGYEVIQYPYMQSLSSGCESIGYDQNKLPDVAVRHLNEIISNNIIWVDQF